MGSCSRRREDGDFESPGFYKCVDDSVLHEGKLCHLQTVSGSWLVGVKRIGEDFFKKGWREFVAGNDLELGQHVVFEYIGHAKFYVEIYGTNHCSRSTKTKEISKHLDDESDDQDVIFVDSGSDSEMPPTSDSSLDLESETESPRESGFQKRRTRNVATISPSGNPCFTVQMRDTHITRGPLLTPRSFLRNLYKPRKVQLDVGKVWKVKWTHPFPRSSRLSGGWLRFAKQNGLEEGDFCDFQLISKTFKVVVMKVSIRKM